MSLEAPQSTHDSAPAPLEYRRELGLYKVQEFQERLLSEQSLPLGLIAGALAALLGAILWAVFTVITDTQIGWMAVGIGFVVGFAVRQFGRGRTRVFGLVGAGLALASCLAGNVLTAAIIIAQQEAVSIVDVLIFLLLSPGTVVEILAVTFTPIDLLFYGLALYEGYRFSFRQISLAERDSLYRTRPL
jgi:hypothetical protein